MTSELKRPSTRRRGQAALPLCIGLILSPPLAHATHDEFMQVWHRPAVVTPPEPAVAKPPAPASITPPVPSTKPASNAAAEASLALSALKDEQQRLTRGITAQNQANLAQTAAENERLLLTGQVVAPVAPTAQTLAPPAPSLNLNVPDKPAFDRHPPAENLKDKRAGLLVQMLDDRSVRDSDCNALTEIGLKQWLGDAVRQAASRTPQLKQIYAEYLAAEADVDQAKGQRWPQLSITAQTREKYFGSERDVPPNPGNSIGLNLSTTVFDWGQNSKTVASRKELATANDEHYQAQLEDLAYQVVNTMLELARQRNVVDLYQHYVDRMQRLCDMLAQIVRADRGRASELTQAQARLLQAETSRDAAAAKARDAELTLHKLIGNHPVSLPRGSDWPIERANLSNLLAKAEQHPAVRQAASQARAADLNADATRASSKPKLSWVVTGNTGRDDAGFRQPWATYLQVSWPLFSGGSQRAATAAAQYRTEAQWHNAEQQKLDYEYQLRTADEDARSSFQRAREYDALSQQTDRIRKGFFEQWYQLGQRSLLDVLSAESDYYNNRIGEVGSRFDAYQAVMREYASAGDLVNWLNTGGYR